MLLSIQNRRTSGRTWLPCPSNINARRFPFALSRVLGSNTRVNHSSPMLSHVQPFELLVQFQSLSLSWGTHAEFNFSPLKMIIGGIAVPSAEIHSTTVTHSVLPGSAS